MTDWSTSTFSQKRGISVSIVLAGRAPGCHLDTQTLKNHPSQHPKTYERNSISVNVFSKMDLFINKSKILGNYNQPSPMIHMKCN